MMKAAAQRGKVGKGGESISEDVTQTSKGLIKRQIAHLSSGTSYIWENIPYPLPYAPTGDYVVEIRPSVWNSSAEPDTLNVPMVVKSTFFRINEDEVSGFSCSMTKMRASLLLTTPRDDLAGLWSRVTTTWAAA